ncbi:NAD-dependent deacylase [Ginsengibacter hankyongi]|uniref:protein acetyllysine N-acetyltransferase n=1 Tax=Ginsengibacter hankyongi TaxID=2607284 RepID=A0A5J5ICE2_9BACT|nr:Sir2 family NAD-dependent protein deacetylase [Ginsengibacter hankyongi]KAA9036361.1 NAD-dependent deacylase [Ginsengibacter hankyongi]
MKKNLVVLTGAGISAESGLKTFRDSDGLWMGYNVYEVATPEGYKKNPKLVLDFYNMRRREVAAAQPNAAHKGIADLQNHYNVTVITQNIDDLHERAGSKNVLHLHGEIFKMRGEKDRNTLYEITRDINVGDLAPDQTQFRPHVVWFNEPVPMIEKASIIMSEADIFILAGTSLQVYPAAGLIDYLPADVPKYIIDIHPPYLQPHHNFYVIKKSATEGIAELLNILTS